MRRLLPRGVVGVDLGTLLLGLLSAKAVAGLLGALTLGFLAQRPLAGVWLVRRVNNSWFYRLAYTGMFLAGSKLLWDGLK